MIKTKQLAQDLQNTFNETNKLGLNFKIFTDTGKFVKAKRELNSVKERVNGLFSVVSSEVENSNTGLVMATMTARLELLVKCKDTEEDEIKTTIADDGTVTTETIREGNSTFIGNLRVFLDNFASKNGYSEMLDDNNEMFSVTYAYSFSATGIRDQISPIGDCFTFSLMCYYSFVEQGDNSRKYILTLDGVNNFIPIQAVTFNRPATIEQDVYADTKNGETKATITGTTFSVSLECPSTVGKFSKAVKEYLFDGENNAHFLTISDGDMKNAETTTYAYLGFFTQTPATAQGLFNVGQKVSFVEAAGDYDLLSFPPELYVYKYSETAEAMVMPSALFVTNNIVEPVYSSASGKVYLSCQQVPSSYTVPLSPGCYVVSPAKLTEEVCNTYNLTLINGGN